MSSWVDVHQSLGHSPVDASPDDFGAAANHFCNVRDNTRTVINQFSTLTGGDTTQFDGQAASAFVNALRGVAVDMRDVPDVADQIAWIFRDHQQALAALRTEVDRALAVAISTRSQRDAHSRELSQTSASLASIRSQLSSLRSSGADESDSQVTYLRSREMNTKVAVNGARARLTASEASLAGAVRQYHEFDAREHELNRRTADRLRSVHLGSMSDPSNAEKAAGWVGDRLKDIGGFTAELISDITALVSAALNGNWQEFMWRVNDVLRAIGTVLAVLAIIATIAIIVIATGGAAAPALLIAATYYLTAASAGVAVLTLASSGLLYAGQFENSETGETMTKGTLVIDAVDAALAVLSFGVAKHLRSVSKLQVSQKQKNFKDLTLSKPHANRPEVRTVHAPRDKHVAAVTKEKFKRWKLRDIVHQEDLRFNDKADVVRIFPDSVDVGLDMHETRLSHNDRMLDQSAKDFLLPPVSCMGPTRGVLVAAQ